MNKRLDSYINNIYKDFDKSDEEVKQLKEEMKSHLLEKVAELKAKGNSEEESVKIAIESFGEEHNVSDELKQVILKQNRVFKLLTKLAVLSFIIASICLIASWVTEKSAMEKWENSKTMTADVVVKESILEPLAKEQNINGTTKANLTQMLDDFNNKNNNGLYYVKATKNNNVVFEYSRTVPENMVINGSGSSTYDPSGLKIEYRTTDFEEMRQMISLESKMNISRASNLLHNKLEKVSFQLFLVFWTLMLVHFIQKTLLENKPDKVFRSFLVVETVLVFAPLTYTDHQESMILMTVIFTLINIIYLWRRSTQKVTERNLYS